jgi:hypothetical protein
MYILKHATPLQKLKIKQKEVLYCVLCIVFPCLAASDNFEAATHGNTIHNGLERVSTGEGRVKGLGQEEMQAHVQLMGIL